MNKRKLIKGLFAVLSVVAVLISVLVPCFAEPVPPSGQYYGESSFYQYVDSDLVPSPNSTYPYTYVLIFQFDNWYYDTDFVSDFTCVLQCVSDFFTPNNFVRTHIQFGATPSDNELTCRIWDDYGHFTGFPMQGNNCWFGFTEFTSVSTSLSGGSVYFWKYARILNLAQFNTASTATQTQYNSGYNAGYSADKSQVISEYYDIGYNQGYLVGHSSGYAEGSANGGGSYSAGYQAGMLDSANVENSGFANWFYSALSAPVRVAQSMFSTEVFGISVWAIFVSILVLCLFAIILKAVIK